MARFDAICVCGVVGCAMVNAASARRMSTGTAGCTTSLTASFPPWMSDPSKINPSDTIDRAVKCCLWEVMAAVSAAVAATIWKSRGEKRRSMRWLEVNRKPLLQSQNNSWLPLLKRVFRESPSPIRSRQCGSSMYSMSARPPSVPGFSPFTFLTVSSQMRRWPC